MPRPRKLSSLFAKAREEQRLLYDWMRANHDDLLAELGEGRKRWRHTMRVIEELSLIDERGNLPSKDTTIHTWRRVRDDVAAARTKRRGAAPPALAPGEVAPGVRAAPGTAPEAGMASPETPRPRLRLDIRPALPLSGGPASPPSSVALPAPGPSAPATADTAATPGHAAPNDAAAEQVRRLLAQMDAAKVPLPKIVP